MPEAAQRPSRRPWAVAGAAVGLAVTAPVVAVAGLAITWLSGIDGSSEPWPALLGLAGAACCLVAAVATWLGRASARVILAAAGVVPLLCVAGSVSSVDLAATVPPTVLGWLILAWVLARPSARLWRSSGRRHPPAS